MANEYIRKDDAISIIEKEMKHYVSDIWYKSATHSALNDVNENIKAIKSADVAPVVHGKWIDHDGNKVQLNEHGETCGTCFCSRCGEWLVASDEYAVKGYFCPNCGAKMDGEECGHVV